MIFISLGKLRAKPTKDSTSKISGIMEEAKKNGIKILGFYWTLGQYDSVLIVEAPSEKDFMKFALKAADVSATETMVAIPREEALKLL